MHHRAMTPQVPRPLADADGTDHSQESRRIQEQTMTADCGPGWMRQTDRHEDDEEEEDAITHYSVHITTGPRTS